MGNRIGMALTGFSGSGKSALSSYLVKEKGFVNFEGSSILRQEAAQSGRVLDSRASYEAFFREQQRFRGMSWLADIALSSPHERVLQTGLRSKFDLVRFRQYGGCVVALTCPPEVCIARIDTSQPKNPKTIAEYEEHMKLEQSADEFGSHTAWCIRNADYTIDTSLPLEATYREIDAIVSERAK